MAAGDDAAFSSPCKNSITWGSAAESPITGAWSLKDQEGTLVAGYTRPILAIKSYASAY